MRKTLFLIMALLITNACSAHSDYAVGGFGYKILNETSVAIGKISDNKKPKGKLVIPSTVEIEGKTYTITAVDDWGFFGCAEITEVVFPSTVTDIGMFAFCKNGIVTLILPETIKTIRSAAFESCESLKQVSLPPNLTILEDRVFSECSALESLNLPESLTSIGSSALSSTGLRHITIPDAVTSVGGYAFASNKQLEDVTLSKSLTKIGNSAFSNCSKLTTITIPEGVITLGSDLFNFCPELTTVNLPASLEEIYSNPFASCSNLTNINIAPGSKHLRLVDGILYSADMTRLISMPPNVKVENFVVPASVKKIASMACFEHREIKSVTMTAVEHIGQSAFYNCSGIASLDLGNKIEAIDKHGFYSCNELTTLNLPSSLKHLGIGVFDFCSKLETVNLYQTLADDNDNFHNLVFEYCPNDIKFVVTKTDGTKKTLSYSDIYDYRQRFPHR